MGVQRKQGNIAGKKIKKFPTNSVPTEESNRVSSRLLTTQKGLENSPPMMGLENGGVLVVKYSGEGKKQNKTPHKLNYTSVKRNNNITWTSR